MKLIWISLGVLLLILAFQFKNILAHVGVELALNGFKELDRNSDGLIQKTEWPGLGFSLVDLNGDNVINLEDRTDIGVDIPEMLSLIHMTLPTKANM